MLIRNAFEKDIPEILNLLSQVLELHHNGRPDIFRTGAVKYTKDELLSLLSKEERPVFVAEDNGNILGYCFCILKQETDNNILTDIKTLYIDDLCVDESCRGKNIGKALYNYALQFAKEKGCYNVTLNVWALNESAVGFYEKLGMKPQKITMENIL